MSRRASGGGDRRGTRLPPDLGRGRRRRGRRRGPRREPGRGRGLPGGQDPGRRLPRRPGHEGDARPGQRRGRPAPSASGWTGEAHDRHTDLGCSAGWRCRDRLHAGAGPVVALPGASGAGGQHRSLRGMARRTPDRDDGPTGASVAMAELRRQAQVGGVIAIVGVVLIFLGFWLR